MIVGDKVRVMVFCQGVSRRIVLGSLLLIFHTGYTAPIHIASPTTLAEQEREQARRLEQIEKAKEGVQSLQSIPSIPETTFDQSETCFEVESVVFSGNQVFSNQEILGWLDFTPSCIGLGEINNFLRVITNKYIAAGYVTSRAFLTPQDLSSGTLQISVLEGKIESILLNGGSIDSLHMAFDGVIGGILNLRDIEQGLDQINRLSRYNAQIQLLPGETQGYSIVDIKTEIGDIGNLELGFNNNGQKSTGEEQLSLSLTGDNIFGLLDKWTLSLTRESEFVESKDSQSAYLSVDVPFGYWNMGYRTSLSSYKTTFLNNDFTFDSTGKTNSHDIDLKWLFYRDSKSKSALKFGVHHRREKNYILGALLDSGSRNLSSLSCAWEHSTQFAGGFLTVSPKLSQGTDWFGGEEHQSHGSNFPTAQFIKGTLSASYSKSVASGVTFNSTAFGQWSNDTLYSNERLSIGGEYSVRGFKGVSLSGDEGYYWRNDMTFHIGHWQGIGVVTSQIALDTGSIIKDSKDWYERGSLMGSSVNISTRNKNYSSALTLGLPIESPSYLNADDFVVYYRLSITI